jgi:hypothetical protein
MASIYNGNSNCRECGRLVAPTSGLYGPLTSSIFCGRKCLRSYYDNQPGLWELDENEAIKFEEQEQIRLQQLWESEKKFKLEEEHRLTDLEHKRIQRRNAFFTIFFILLLLALVCSNVWIWLIFSGYCLYLIKRWCNN